MNFSTDSHLSGFVGVDVVLPLCNGNMDVDICDSQKYLFEIPCAEGSQPVLCSLAVIQGFF